MVPPDMDTETVAKPVMENGYEDDDDDENPIVLKRRSSVASSSKQSKSKPQKLALVRKEIQDETDRITGKSKQISPVPIHLSIFSPNVVNLTLIDLPGLTKVAVEGQPETIVEDIESMVRTYVDKPNHIIVDTSRESKHRWTLPEEKILVNAWLNTRKDAVVGNEQKGGTFWNRVAAYYAASPSVSNLPIRKSNTCKQKWAKIHKSVSKFAGYYDYASRQHRSGDTEDDVMELAYKLYFQDEKVKFTLEHAWRLLKNDQKWCTLVSLKNSQTTKKNKRSEGVAYSSSSNTDCQVEEGTTKRFMGVKASKAKGKKKHKLTTEDSKSSSVRELKELWVTKDKDLIIKERLSKQKLLNSLIAKSGPLSEIEETLKNKLITEML